MGHFVRYKREFVITVIVITEVDLFFVDFSLFRKKEINREKAKKSLFQECLLLLLEPQKQTAK
jgi:hypothetical protein